MDVENIQHWEQLLLQLAQPNTEIVQNATATVQKCLQNVKCVPMLLQLVKKI